MRIKLFKMTLFSGLFLTVSACTELTSLQNPHKKEAEANVHVGMAYLDKGHVQKAEEKFALALQQDRLLPEAWYSMAYSLEKRGKLQEANEYYLQAISLAPYRGDVQNNYGTFLCRAGDYKAALPHFMAAAQDPNYPSKGSAYENAGQCATKIPDKVLAKNYFAKALEMDPNCRIARVRLAKSF